MVNILYVLPQNYEGPIVVLYGQKDGKPKEYYNNDWRVYRINKDGTLKTQFKHESNSFLIERYCYEEELNKWLTPIYMYDSPDKWDIYPPKKLENDNIYIHMGPTEIHSCGLLSYELCGFSVDTLVKQVDYYFHSHYNYESKTDVRKIEKIIDSLYYLCK